MFPSKLRRSHPGLWRVTVIVAVVHALSAVEALLPGRHDAPAFAALKDLLGEGLVPFAVAHAVLAVLGLLCLRGNAFRRAGLLRFTFTASTALFTAQGTAFLLAALTQPSASFLGTVLSYALAAVCTAGVVEPVSVVERYDTTGEPAPRRRAV